ncbi:hypothetical protein AZE42_08948 [Rhizopogon vesiculosus]|uniref:Uncharacterized protein n=1 Tax=Rhizopogon vesiculosus TaxID=180088 RepID=A0A1J8QWZ2_9AGAM|nr:hypothetical protein AZE42_08948 [Rhizopogon vesiculosus]
MKPFYEELENFAADPKQVVPAILSTPGCPPFPPGEWLNIVKWKYVDLAKDRARFDRPEEGNGTLTYLLIPCPSLRSNESVELTSKHDVGQRLGRGNAEEASRVRR